MRLRRIMWTLPLVTVLFSIIHYPLSAANAIIVAVTDEPIVEDVKRFGINLGSHNQYGSAQILRNVIVNPGFEGGEFATIFLAGADANAAKFQADNWFTEWDRDAMLQNGQPPGFWDGAAIELLTGEGAGLVGEVISFTHEADRYTFYLDGISGTLAAGDAIAVRKVVSDVVAGCCADENQQPDRSQTRPGSPGTQSLKLLPPSGSTWLGYSYYMDSYWRDGDRSAGKLIVADGVWRLSVWAKAEHVTDSLRIVFHRENEALFFEETIALSSTWQLIERDIVIPDGTDVYRDYTESEYHPIIGLKMNTTGGSGAVWIDDILLYRVGEDDSLAFSDRFVERLQELQPGILRNWGQQLGSSLDNQLAVPWARRTTGWRMTDSRAGQYHFSLHDFLELAQIVGSEPWYVIPPTFSDEEVANLIAYLSAPTADGHPYAQLRAQLGQEAPWTEVFEMIHLEYGNEMWGSAYGGDPFWGATVRGGERVGELAARRFSVMRQQPTFDAERIDLIIGGQTGFVQQNEHIERMSDEHDMLALSPYFGQLETWQSDAEIFQPLFANPFAATQTGTLRANHDLANANDRRLAVYEINFHTTSGNSPIEVRNDFVTGAGSGLALPLHMLQFLRELQIRDQAAFNVLQYSFPLYGSNQRDVQPPWLLQQQVREAMAGNRPVAANGGLDYVRLWGMLRDLEATERRRPTWLGLQLANQAIAGDMIATMQLNTPSWLQPPINGISQPIEVSDIQSFAFRDGGDYALVLFNLSLSTTHGLRLSLPGSPQQATIHQLSAQSIHADNESSEDVTIESSTLLRPQRVVLEPHSMVVIKWQQAPPPTAVDLSGTAAAVHTPALAALLFVVLSLMLFVVRRARTVARDG